MEISKNIECRIQPIASAICRINPVEIVTATNVAEAKKSWLKPVLSIGYFGNPQFNYDYEHLKEVAHQQEEFRLFRRLVREEMEPESPANEVAKELLIARLDEAIQATELAASICNGNDKAARIAATNIYGHPDNVQVLKCLEQTSEDYQKPKLKSRFDKKELAQLEKLEFDAEDIKYWFEQVLDLYHIAGWRVEVGDQYTAIDVRDKNATGQPVVGIPSDRKVNGKKLLELIGHEIECHLRGSENCRALVKQILGSDNRLAPFVPILAKSDNELLYEGTAKISDVDIGGDSVMPLPYATIACDQARRGENFGSIAHTLFGLMYQEAKRTQKRGEKLKVEAIASRAWNTTYRIFRGSTNTAAGEYCFSKDYVYFCGYEKVKELNPSYLDFASMKIEELNKITEVFSLKPLYPHKDAVGFIRAKIL